MSYISTIVSVSAGTPATEDQTGYEAKSYGELGRVVSHSEVGDTHTDQSVALLKTGRTSHGNGTVDGGEITLTIDGEDFTDAGLAIIEAKNGTQDEVSFKFEGPNQTRYVYGIIRNLRTMTGDTQTKAGMTFVLAVNSGVTRVAAA